MTKGTLFGAIHSSTDLGLIQQRVEVSPAAPKTNYVDIPGGDGSKDLTESLGVGVKYKDREITWTFGLYPGQDWYAKQQQVSGALNGLACHITLDDDPDYYYDGRLEVSGYSRDKLLRQITVRAVCRPYKSKLQLTTVARDDLDETYKALTLTNGRMPVVPSITVGQETSIKFGGATYVVTTGTHTLPGIRLVEGANTLEASTASGTGGTISVEYREGAL